MRKLLTVLGGVSLVVALAAPAWGDTTPKAADRPITTMDHGHHGHDGDGWGRHGGWRHGHDGGYDRHHRDYDGGYRHHYRYDRDYYGCGYGGCGSSYYYDDDYDGYNCDYDGSYYRHHYRSNRDYYGCDY